MIENLPPEILNIVKSYSQNADWKHLMDTSKESFEDLKYKTIQVYVSFNKLKDRVLPSFVSRLLDPSQQLNLHINLDDMYDCVNCRLKRMNGWRSDGRLSVKDIKWFLSLPARSLSWPLGGLFLDNNRKLIRALRKYETIFLTLHDDYSTAEMDFSDLNHCKRIKSLTLKQSENFSVPILPSLTELHIHMDDNIDLTNLVYSLSLKKVTISEGYNITIPEGLKERGVILDIEEDVDVEEAYVPLEEEDQDESEEFSLYEDEVTVYDEEDRDED